MPRDRGCRTAVEVKLREDAPTWWDLDSTFPSPCGQTDHVVCDPSTTSGAFHSLFAVKLSPLGGHTMGCDMCQLSRRKPSITIVPITLEGPQGKTWGKIPCRGQIPTQWLPQSSVSPCGCLGSDPLSHENTGSGSQVVRHWGQGL